MTDEVFRTFVWSKGSYSSSSANHSVFTSRSDLERHLMEKVIESKANERESNPIWRQWARLVGIKTGEYPRPYKVDRVEQFINNEWVPLLWDIEAPKLVVTYAEVEPK